MNILITGGLGFVGRRLSRALLNDGHRVTTVDLADDPDVVGHPDLHHIAADTTRPGDWQEPLADQDVVVNLAGKSIFTLWSAKARQQIHDSRILTTRNLVAALPAGRRTTLCNASAVGYYGDRGEVPMTEGMPPGGGFLAAVSRDWEQEALKAEARGVRVVRTRFGIVLDHDGGALATMIPTFRFFLGGRLGSGRQWFPWVHIQDLIAAIRFLIEESSLVGPFNCTAPEPVRNEELTRTLGRELHRPTPMRVPAFLIKLALGELGDVMLGSQRAMPGRLAEAGFAFIYPDLRTALEEIIRRWRSTR